MDNFFLYSGRKRAEAVREYITKKIEIIRKVRILFRLIWVVLFQPIGEGSAKDR